MTYSIVAFDPETKELGVAVASKFLAVGAFVPYAKAGIGAVATQSFVNPHYGPDGLALMAGNRDVDDIIKQMTEDDESGHLRQVGIINASGDAATYTGTDCFTWSGGVSGKNYACQGNVLAGKNVIKAMVDSFENSTGPLAERLLNTLKAGEDAGGDSRGKQSASLLVVKEKGGYQGANDRYIDLRSDEHENPLEELSRMLYLHNMYFKEADPDDIVKIDNELRAKLQKNLFKLNFSQNEQLNDKDFYESLKSFHLIENFDERVQETGYIDEKVIEYMDDLVKKG